MGMNQKYSRVFLGVVISILFGGCQRGSIAWDQFVERTVEEYLAMNPHIAVDEGRHEYDGMVPDLSQDAIQKEWAWTEAKRETALKFPDEELSEAQQFERDYLVAELDGTLYWLEDVRLPAKSVTYYTGAISTVYVTREYAPLAVRMKAFTSMAGQVPTIVAHAKANLELPLPITFVKRGRISAGGLASFFEDDVPLAFSAVEDAALQQAFRDSVAVAVAALRDLDSWLEEQEATATDDFALGAELYKAMLWKTSRVDIDLATLEAIGRADLAKNQAALAAECEALAPEGTLQECLEIVMNDKPEDGPVEEARRQLAGLRELVVTAKLVSIPGTEVALVDTSPPYMRWNSAFINIPGPYEENMPSTYYISPPDPSWSEEDQWAYVPGKKDLLFTSIHEVWPGHFLSYLHRNRSKSIIGRLFGSYASSEGWAHYAEELMVEANLNDGDPATHIGQLLNALLRNVRYLSSIGMHTQGMTVEESERMFREEAYQDPGNARQQAARGTYDPGYLNYTLGKLMIRQIRADWTATRGGRKAWKAFHDKFLSYGAPPVPLVRVAMLGPDAGPALKSN